MRDYITKFKKLYPKHSTYANLEETNLAKEPKVDTPTIGFSQKNQSELDEWCTKTFVHHQIVLFDWDKTLSVCNGIINGEIYTNLGIEIIDVALFLFGGVERLKMIQSIFEYLHTIPDLHIFIITRNGDAKREMPVHRKNFLDIIHFIDANFLDDNLIYAPYDKSKPETLLETESFSTVFNKAKMFPTTKLGGKHRKQKRNSNKKRKFNIKKNSKRNTSRKYDRLLLLQN